MEISEGTLQDHIPRYLTEDQRSGFITALRDFPHCNYYLTSQYDDDVLQGDCWGGFQIYDFDSEDKISVKAVVLSNSCDIDPSNSRSTEVKITFAPMVHLEDYRESLEKANISSEAIQSKISAIKEQKITNIFFLPAGAGIEKDSLLLLDDVHSVPYRFFEQKRTKPKIFTLSQIGFYLFIFKLSFHFCRLHENIDRSHTA